MKQFRAFVRKEFYHVFRDTKTLLLLFGLPIVQIVLFGFALTNEIKNSKIVICDNARDNASMHITQKFWASAYFDIQQSLLSHAQIEEAFKKGDIKLAVVFPQNFQYDLLHSAKAQVQIICDASDPNTGTTLTNYASSIIQDFQKELMPVAKVPYQI